MSFGNRRKGFIGERIAEDFLCGLGFETITRNFRCRFGEIDLVMRDKDCIVFVEVKSGRVEQFGAPVERITDEKRARMMKAIMHYLNSHRISDCRIRVDVVSVVQCEDKNFKIDYIPNAFEGRAEPWAPEED